MKFLKKPTLRQIEIAVDVVEKLREEDSAEVWEKKLLAAGMLTMVPRGAGSEPEWSPHRALARIARSLARLHASDEAIATTRAMVPFLSQNLGGEVHGWIAVSTYGFVVLVGSFFWSLLMSAAAWAALVGILVHLGRSKAEKRRRLTLLLAERDLIRRELAAEVRELCRHNFVAAVGPNLLICRPHLRWLTTRFHDLSRRLTHGGPTTDTSTLAGDLQTEMTRLSVRFEELGTGENEGWTEEQLNAPIRELSARLAKASARVPSTIERLDELLLS